MYAKLYSERCATTVVCNVFVEPRSIALFYAFEMRFSIYCYVKGF